MGVDVNGEDLLNEAAGEFVYNFTQPCPNACPTNSALLSDEPIQSQIEEEGNIVSVQNAAEWTKKWRAANKDQAWWSQYDFAAFTVDTSNFSNLLNQGASNIRAYFAINPDDQITLIFAGAQNRPRGHQTLGSKRARR